MSKKGSKTKRTQSKAKKSTHTMLPEVIGMSIIGVAILVIASLFTNQVGLVGVGIKNLFVGLFGLGGYIIPVYGLCIGWFYVRGNLSKIIDTAEYVVPFILILITFLHVINYGDDTSISLMSLEYIRSASYFNGGWVGAALGQLMVTLLGLYGTYIVLVVFIGIWILFTTQFPILSWLQELLENITQQVKQNIQNSKEVRRHNKLQKQSLKQKKVEKELLDDEPPLLIAREIPNREVEIQTYVEPEREPIIIYQEEYAAASVQEDTPAIPSKTKQEAPLKEDEKLEVDMTYEEKEYVFPSINLLSKGEETTNNKDVSRTALANAKKLEDTLASFGVEAKVLQIHKGPTVTRYELQPKQGVKVSKIVNLADDIALNLAASGIRIEAPIPGKSAVGIEVPNEASEMVYLREVIDTDNFVAFPSKLAFALGKDIGGKPIITDIGKMPHILIAGATGSGKSVCINTLITSILYKAKPSEVKLIMIDPKVVELNVYNGIPHLLIPVVTDPRKAAGALCWAVNEMTKRYNAFAENNVRDMKGYNNKMTDPSLRMPNIVIIIDELADLMMTAAKEVEDAICRLAQMARAAGIHLVIATQRPSVDVITGVIKANIPSRLAFAVSSGIDSRTILDSNGAEKLLGKGDMLFYPVGESKPIRIQGAFISDREVEEIVEAVKQTGEASYQEEVIQSIDVPRVEIESSDEDEFLIEAINLTKGKDKISISMLQRYFRIGFNRASRLMEALEARGVVGPDEGSKPRKVLNQLIEEREDV